MQVTQSKGKKKVGAGEGPRHLVVEPDREGQRIDNLLLRELKGVPRSRIYSMLRRGEVRVDGRRVRAGHRLQAGAEVRLPPVRTAAAGEAASVSRGLGERLAEAVLFEDADLLVVDKPPGLAVHGGSGVSVGLVEALRALRPELRFLELAHRIDRDTSGVVLLAKRRPALKALHAALRERRALKYYVALVDGRWPPRLERLEAPLERVLAPSGERFVRVSAAGKPASTRVAVARRLPGATLLDLNPSTGRTHQLRVHLAHAGHPILGDPKYAGEEVGARAKRLGVRRLCLHAASIELPEWREARSGTRRFEAPLPRDMQDVLARLEADGDG